MKNKKKIIYGIIVLAVVLFIGLYFIYHYSEPNILSSKDKKWLSENNKNIVSVDVINDIPLYSYNGEGVVYKFLDYISEQASLEFNKKTYLKENKNLSSKYSFELIDGSSKLNSNQLLFYTDSYVLVSKQDKKINSINELNNMTLGVFQEDSANISYYLSSVDNIKYFNYGKEESLFKALDENEVNAIVIPNVIFLNKTIKEDYHINYFFTEITKNLVLTLDSSNDELNTIIKKCYDYWFSNYYVDQYNDLFLDYYIEESGINDKTKADLLSKTYVYGYVENAPYEKEIGNTLEGIAIEYINRIVRLTNIEIKYEKYKDVESLKNAYKNGDVDIYFDYFGDSDSKYLQTKSVFIENYVVLGKYDQNYVIGTLESLKGKDVVLIKDNYLQQYISNNTKANVKMVNNVNELVEDSNKIIILDKEVYTYYHDDLFNDYDILYSSIMTFDYSFMVKSNNESFYKLFNYIINTNSYYNYRNNAYINLNTTLFERVSFEELYLIILAIILVPILVIGITILIIRNKHHLKIVRKEDRKKYTDMLTSLKNRNYLNLSIEEWNNCKIYPQTIIVLDLNNTKYINDNYGREKGDLLIVKAASILINTQLENSEIIRSDGNEFIIYMVGYNENQVETYVNKLSTSLKDLPYGFGAAVGYSMITDNIKTIDDAINEATIEMQSDKESYR